MATPDQTQLPLPDRAYQVVGAAVAAAVVFTIAVALRCCSRALVKAGKWIQKPVFTYPIVADIICRRTRIPSEVC